MTEIISIEADDRERPSGIPDLLGAETGVRLTLRRLSLGDYLVNGRLLFERKTMRDFAQSIVDGRLFRQARGLANSRWRPALVLEDPPADRERINVPWEALQGGLVTVSLIFAIPVLRSETPAETARLLIYSGTQECRHAAGLLKRPGYRPRSKAARQRYILQGMPGVGPTRAARLLERFGSVRAVLNATVADLTGVAGIGRRTAELICETVQEPGEAHGSMAEAATGDAERGCPPAGASPIPRGMLETPGKSACG